MNNEDLNFRLQRAATIARLRSELAEAKRIEEMLRAALAQADARLLAPAPPPAEPAKSFTCETCEGIGLVEKMGPAGVPHTIPCPRCRATMDPTGKPEWNAPSEPRPEETAPAPAPEGGAAPRISDGHLSSLEDEAINGEGPWSLTPSEINDLVLDLADARRAARSAPALSPEVAEMVAELRRLDAEATQGEWAIVHDSLDEFARAAFNPWILILIGLPKSPTAPAEAGGFKVITDRFIAKIEDHAPTEKAEAESRANARLIVALRNALPALLRALTGGRE